MVISLQNGYIVAILFNSVTFRNMAIFSLVVTDHSDSDFAILRPGLCRVFTGITEGILQIEKSYTREGT